MTQSWKMEQIIATQRSTLQLDQKPAWTIGQLVFQIALSMMITWILSYGIGRYI